MMFHIQTFSGFRVRAGEREIPPTAWTREKALHLFQLLVTLRRTRPHKEQIIDLLWPDLDPETGDRDFRVALNAIQNALEPDRAPRAPSSAIVRSELNYGLNPDVFRIDADLFEDHLAAAHRAAASGTGDGAAHYQAALALYHGDYLPERRYDDWTASERERLHTLALGALTRLAEILLPSDPLETIRLTRRALELDPLWENAYRIEIQAYLATGNRPMAIRTYERCAQVLKDEFGLAPLPETEALIRSIA
ncbi:MAG TPA: bacterial transcriptional activator domain-containing protein [Anaerolineales bacterium]|nr:bacterial transcriptional activator domain-containing protein [Anaerolineales bacterium]